jgi:xylulokinase
MSVLAIDVGSSSVKAAVFRGRSILGSISRQTYPTRHDGVKVEVDPEVLLGAIARAIADLSRPARTVDAISLSVMSPAWVAMDKRGRAITPIVTHQDRRSVAIAQELENRVGRARHLKLAGNRPFPGSISSTTCAFFLRHHKSVMAKADLVGHLNTLIHRSLTGSRVIDPSNASFTGLYLTCAMSTWSDELCHATGISKSKLPVILDANAIAGRVTNSAATEFGLTAGTPVLTGIVDTSAAVFYAGTSRGQLFHMCGSTDVLAVVSAKPHPHERLLTRAFGIGRKWISAATQAASGSAIDWMRRELFHDLTDAKFRALLSQKPDAGPVRFDPYLAGDRMGMEPKNAAFTGLTLATKRHQMLSAVVESLASDSRRRLDLLREVHRHLLPTVGISGGGAGLAKIMHRDWPGKWKFREVTEAVLRGLAAMAEKKNPRIDANLHE